MQKILRKHNLTGCSIFALLVAVFAFLFCTDSVCAQFEIAPKRPKQSENKQNKEATQNEEAGPSKDKEFDKNKNAGKNSEINDDEDFGSDDSEDEEGEDAFDVTDESEIDSTLTNVSISDAPIPDKNGAKDNGPKFGRSATKTWQTGFTLQAVADCSDMVFIIPIPKNWPEQKVVIHEEKATDRLAKVSRKETANKDIQYMYVQVPKLPAGAKTQVLLTVETTRSEILPPDKSSTAKLSFPKKIPSSMRQYLDESPKIESKNRVFKDLFTSITKDKKSDWEKVEAIYKYVQDNIRYDDANKAVAGNSALETLKLKRGDCKEMTAVFIAICRAGRVPARTVWVPGHCYVEFYLEDDEEKGYWFPCQVSGTYAFGGIPELGPVLQKGDNFTFKDIKNENGRGLKKFRFVPPLCTGKNDGGKEGEPKYIFIDTSGK
ncbi:MAG: transglutaminase-like domain-containing protein [Thermoguttaceae bacterium]